MAESLPEFGWGFLTQLAELDPDRPLSVALDSAREQHAKAYPAADVADTDATCVYCRHSVEDQQHYEGCAECACPHSIVPEPID